jgi:hypothetical protein
MSFKDKDEEVLVFMVGTANLLGQMASRSYLEKLFFLYDRVREAKIINTASISFILKKTVDFYQNRAKDRLEKDFKGLHKLSKFHFNERYKINRNLYIEAIEKQLSYLETILNRYPRSYWKKLRRM